MSTDEELLAAWGQGDRAAGSELFTRHYSTVRRFFANKADDAAEDLIQQTFASCVAGRARFEGRSSFRTYLLGIARNLLRQHWEARRGRGQHIDIEEVSLAELGAGPSTLISRDRDHRRLLDALRQVPLEQQIILELYYWEGLSGSALGEALGVGEDTARSRLRRAKVALGKEFRRLERFAGVPESTDENLERWAFDLRAKIASRA
ncbi:MAG: sigma-70 family RNA polymerase sigma factor [Enhygromyxa sp.]